MNEKREITDEKLVWDIYKSLGEQCQHFNNLESTYRTLTSSWLLGAFAATGFIIKEVDANAAWLVVGVCGAAAVGVFLLWLLDLMVYQRLLGATFTEQWNLEDQYSWLPRVAHGMMAAHRGKGVVPKLVWFYVSTYLLLVGIASLGLAVALAPSLSRASVFLLSGAVFLGAGCVVAAYMHRAATERVGRAA